jgi:hypothetical protein
VDFSTGFDSAPAGHVDVEEHYIVVVSAKHGQSLFAATGFPSFEAKRLE